MNNGINLNINKYNTISFSKKRNIITFSYNLYNHSLIRVSQIKDFGIIFDSKLLFNIYVLKMSKKKLSQFLLQLNITILSLMIL